MLTSSAVVQDGNYEKYYSAAVFGADVFERAKSLFDEYRSGGVILTGGFDDSEWKLTNQLKTTTISFKFDELGFHRNAASWLGCNYDIFIKSVKAYAMFRMGSTSIASIREVVNSFRLFSELSESALPGVALEHQSHMAAFLAALPGESIRRDSIIEIFEERQWGSQPQSGKTRQRVLADFGTYFKFNDAMRGFWECANDTEKLFWFPLYLWWTLTAILPLRTTEFLLTPRKCLSSDNGKNMVTLRRTLQKGGARKLAYRIEKDYETVRYEIADGMAGDIIWYLDVTDAMTPTSLSTLFVREPHYAAFNRKPSTTSGYYTYANLSTCLKRFQGDIMGAGADSKINLGDTRHLAMISLILSGGSPLICKELAGHEDINISSNYYSNISGFVECATYEMHLKSRGWSAELAEHGATIMRLTKQRTPVQGGFCDSEAYVRGEISDCIKSISADGELGCCLHCPHFIDGHSGVHFLYQHPSKRKEQVDKDSQYLLRTLEAVRRGIGLPEDIQSALLRLQQSGAWYGRCLQYEWEVTGRGKTKKIID